MGKTKSSLSDINRAFWLPKEAKQSVHMRWSYVCLLWEQSESQNWSTEKTCSCQHKRTSRAVEGQYIWKIESLIDGKRRSITGVIMYWIFFLVRCEIVQRGLESNLLCFSVRFVNKIKDMNLLNQERLLLQRPDNVLLTLS